MIKKNTLVLTILVAFSVVVPAAAQTDVIVDSVGVTGLDAQNYGPALQRVYNLPGVAIYVAWLKTGMFYNHFSYGTSNWLGEREVFDDRNISGNLDVDVETGSPREHSAFVSSRTSRDPKYPVVGIESLPGSGNFTVRATGGVLPEHNWPVLALTPNGDIHLACADAGSKDTLLYSRSEDDGVTWSAPFSVCGTKLPKGPTFNIAASEASNRLAVVWSNADSTSLWVNTSSDGGTNWSEPTDLFPVPTSITNARPGAMGGYAVFDRNDRLNVVTQAWDGLNQHPAEIWHYQEGRGPDWTLVSRFAPGQVVAQAEPGEPFACRPTFGERSDGRLFVAWMTYDSVNYEPSTQIARSDIFIAQSETNGESWSRPFRATGPDSMSRLSPCIASTATDTLVLACVEDKVAGIYEYGNGPQTTNRVLVLRLRVGELPGVADRPGRVPAGSAVSINPVPVRHTARINLPQGTSRPLLRVRDQSGRVVETLRPQTGSFVWNASSVASGVYFIEHRTGDHRVQTRVVVSH